MSRRFASGDVVQLKSGGPKMTLQYYVNDNRVVCAWFEGAEHKTAAFAPDTLKLYEEPNLAIPTGPTTARAKF
jgi:uncharacterized protein YodC (DUF2158 family)